MSEQRNFIIREIVRYIIYLVVVLGLTALAFYLTVGDKITDIFNILKNANVWFVLLILGIVVGCILLRSTSIFVLTRLFQKDYFFHRSIMIDQVGCLYRMVTPAGVGGHVMETYTYSKQHVKISDALSVIAMYSIIYQIVLIAYGVITICVKADLVNEIGYISISFNNASQAQLPLWLLIGIGFGFNILSIGFILLISYWNGLARFVRGPFFRMLHKFKVIKDLEKEQEKLDAAIINFRANLKTIFKHIPTFLICFVCFFAYITISYSVPYFCGLSLGNTSVNANFWDSVLLSNFHQMVTCIIPIPGSSVVSELFFLRLFYPTSGPAFFDTEEIARAALLLWRGLMFIFPLIIACLVTIIYRPRKIKENENLENQDIKE